MHKANYPHNLAGFSSLEQQLTAWQILQITAEG